jgi:hypothetical protein
VIRRTAAGGCLLPLAEPIDPALTAAAPVVA